MEKSIKIKGIKESDHAILYASVKKNMVAYNLSKINVKIIPGEAAVPIQTSLFGTLIVTQKLLEIMNEEEIEMIVAHEFSHIVHRDSIIRFIFNPLILIPSIIFVVMLCINIFNRQVLYFLFITIFIFLLYVVIYIKIFYPIFNLQEIRSDLEAALKIKNPEAMISALRKWDSELRSKPSYSEKKIYASTHPSLKIRLEYLELLSSQK